MIELITIAIKILADAWEAHERGDDAEAIATQASDKIRRELQRRIARARFETATKKAGKR